MKHQKKILVADTNHAIKHVNHVTRTRNIRDAGRAEAAG